MICNHDYISVFRQAIRLFLLAALMTGLAHSAGAAPRAPSATFTVTKTADTNDGVCDGDCSLREAIQAANASPGPDNVIVPNGTFILDIAGSSENNGATGDLDIRDDLTITGQGTLTTFIDGGDIDRVFHVAQDSITVTITQLTIQNGAAPDDDALGGGAILNSGVTQPGTLALLNTVIKTSTASRGGGVSNNNLGTLIIDGSTISENAALLGGEGGGIYSDGGLQVTASEILYNGSINGAGAYGTAKATMSFENTLFEGNQATGYGGGVYNDQSIQFKDVMLISNHAVRGGGLYNNYNAILERVTISGNQAPDGAGMYSAGWASLDNVTISGNQHPASNRGAGIFNNGVLWLVNSTLYKNQSPLGANLYNFEEGTATIRNSIIAAAFGDQTCFNEGTLVSQGYNLTYGYLSFCSFTAIGDRTNQDPKLNPLADNGGATFTHEPQSNSPAVDTGDPKNCPVTDQRIRVRPVDGDNNGAPACDIGAFEFDWHDLVGFDPIEYTATEGTIKQLNVRRFTDGNNAISVSYRAQTIPRTDFVLTPGMLSWSASDPVAVKSFTITILNDIYAEGDETVRIILDNFTGGVGVEYPNHVARITIPANDAGGPLWPPDVLFPIIRK